MVAASKPSASLSTRLWAGTRSHTDPAFLGAPADDGEVFVADVHKTEFRLENFTVRRAADLIPPDNREGPIVLFCAGLGQARLVDNVMLDDMD